MLKLAYLAAAVLAVAAAPASTLADDVPTAGVSAALAPSHRPGVCACIAGSAFMVAGQYDKAMAAFLKGAAVGEPVSMNGIGFMYEQGWGVPVDLKAALSWFQKSAALGTPAAEINLGHLYEVGLGVPRDVRSAERHYRTAGALGDTRGLTEFAMHFLDGTVGNHVDDGKAMSMFLETAAQGDGVAMNEIGYMRLVGKIGQPDPAAAYCWFRAATQSGWPAAVKHLTELEAAGQHGPSVAACRRFFSPITAQVEASMTGAELQPGVPLDGERQAQLAAAPT